MMGSENKQHLENILEDHCKNQATAHCQERSFVRLPGYVDLDVFSTNSLTSLREEPLKIAATVCKLKPAEEHQIMSFQAFVASQEHQVLDNVRQQIEILRAMQMSPP